MAGAAGVLPAEKKMPTNQRKSFNITCTSKKPKVVTTKASLPMIASLQVDLENVSFASGCSYFCLISIGMQDWGENSSNALRYSSYHALVLGRLLDSLDNVQITLYPGANTQQIRRSYYIRQLVKLRH